MLGGTTDIRFGPYRLDLMGRVLTRGGEALSLGGRAFDTLAILVGASGATVAKETLLDQVWPGLAVAENNLQVQISALRKTLGEGWIITVPGRGYRLAEPAVTLPEMPSDHPTIAVLAFENMSGDPEQAYFADGMADEIITALSRIRSFVVIARNSSFTYKGRAVDVKQIGRELDVRYVLEGSVRRAGGLVRITSQLVEAASGAHLWADRFDGELTDMFDLQDRITANVVGAIEPRIRAVEIARAHRKPPENLHAYDLLLRALPLVNSWTREGIEDGIVLLRRAIAADPGYAPALVALARSLRSQVTQGWLATNAPAIAEMQALTAAALRVAPDDPEVLAMAAFIKAHWERDQLGSIRLYEEALRLNPNSMFVLLELGALRGYRGEIEAALEYAARAERLNPLEDVSPRQLIAVLAHFAVGDYWSVIRTASAAQWGSGYRAAILRYLAASLGLVGCIDEGREAVAKLRAIVPGFSILQARSHLVDDLNNPFGRQETVDAFCDGLRRVGVQEQPNPGER